MPTPVFKKGHPKPPNSGRKKGVQNKVSVAVREAVQIAFDQLGGADGLVKWVTEDKRNKAAFYNIAAKLIPHRVEGAEGESLIPQVPVGAQLVGIFLQAPTPFQKPPEKTG